MAPSEAMVSYSGSGKVDHSDLELRLLQAFGAYATDKLVSSYFYIKNSSRLAAFIASTTEQFITKSGLSSLVEFLFTQYQKVGHQWVQSVDEAMGRRIVDAFVAVLLLAKEQQTAQENDVEAGPAGKLSLQERIEVLLAGEMPRLQLLLNEANEKALAAENASVPPPAMVMDLKDFVPAEDVKRIKEANREQLAAMQSELAQLRDQAIKLEHEKEKLEQDLTDVHNYQESERGQRFLEMEEELARSKLEANQKAHDLRKLELVVEAFRKKRRAKSSRSTTGRSSEGNHSP